MTINASIHIEAGGSIKAYIGAMGQVVIEARPEAHNRYTGIAQIHIYKNYSPAEHARLCKAFELQEQTAPDEDVEDGVVPAGNEPERMSA